MSNIQKQHKISPAIAWLTIQKFIIFYCPLDGEHTSLLARASIFAILWGDSEGIYSLAVHGVTFSFALNFLDLTTFLRQILGKIYSSDFLTTFYDNGLWFIPQQVQFPADSF